MVSERMSESASKKVSQKPEGDAQAVESEPLGKVTTGKSGVPLYLQVARELKAAIVSGEFPVGAQLPTEDKLCQQFSVSRYTVREALRLLRDDGLVSSRQGAGTVVVPPRHSSADIHQVMSINDLVALASASRFAVESIDTVEITPQLALRTGLTAGEKWLEVRGFRYSDEDGTPLCRAEYYINRAFAAVGRLLQRHTGPIFPLIEDLFGQSVSEVHQQISAVLVSPQLAEGLKVDEGSAALEVRRTYVTSDEQVAQVTINTHPSASFQHSMIMRRVKT